MATIRGMDWYYIPNEASNNGGTILSGLMPLHPAAIIKSAIENRLARATSVTTKEPYDTYDAEMHRLPYRAKILADSDGQCVIRISNIYPEWLGKVLKIPEINIKSPSELPPPLQSLANKEALTRR
jgi:hypothetical protein